jgi:hypothetical protein
MTFSAFSSLNRVRKEFHKIDKPSSLVSPWSKELQFVYGNAEPVERAIDT